MKKIAISVPIVSFLNSVFMLIEFESTCYNPKNYDISEISRENALGLCEEGEMAYIQSSNLRSLLEDKYS